MRGTMIKFLGIVAVGLMLVLMAPATSFAEGRGKDQRRDHDSRDWDERHDRDSHRDKKCEKFVNCHDARDGRVDGRGPDRRGSDDRSWRRNHEGRRSWWRNRQGRFDDRERRDDFWRRRERRRNRTFRS